MLTAKDIEQYRTKLTDLAGWLERTMTHDRRGLLQEEEPDLAGGSMPATDGEVAGAAEVGASVIATEAAVLTEVSAALNRIAAGTFGRCAECSRPIARSRLDALPYARHCIRCARVSEGAAT